jgi:hypothetical protein
MFMNSKIDLRILLHFSGGKIPPVSEFGTWPQT